MERLFFTQIRQLQYSIPKLKFRCLNPTAFSASKKMYEHRTHTHHISRLKGQSHEKVCEIMTWDARIGLNKGSPTVFNSLKSAV
jgi:hypothetical protein